ncbi:MAG: hypothetical protein WBG30_14410 [Psychrilyobacter sp.]|uniref:hypothetical protein n=1 Tax=Psychrilyobacter sp. TaxID=2586924 RepID=UPI003C77EE65
MWFNINKENKQKNSRFILDGWRNKVANENENRTFILDGWKNKIASDKCFKTSINGWKNSIIR